MPWMLELSSGIGTPGSSSQLSRRTMTPPREMTTPTSMTRSRVESRPVVSVSMNAIGASTQDVSGSISATTPTARTRIRWAMPG